MDTCENCGGAIGKLETPCIFDNHVVCFACDVKLRAAAVPAVGRDFDFVAADESPSAAVIIPDYLPVSERTPTPARSSVAMRACPACGSHAVAVKKSKGSSLLLIVLLLLWIIPGLIYMIVYNGYVYACPKCGFKYGDAA